MNSISVARPRRQLAAALLAGVSVTALGAATVPAQAGTSKGYDAYVACGMSKHAPASHSCPTDSKKAAFFLSTASDVSYTVCVKFPNRHEPLCAPSQQAKRGHLYRNRITSTTTGKHRVTWLVDGQQVGSFRFRVTK